MAATLRASKQGLELVDQARRKKGWTATAKSWYDAAQTSVATLKRFRQGLSIDRDVFVAICKAVGIEDWEAIVDNSPAQPTTSLVLCSAYNEETWVGREQLIDQLSQKLKRQCRVLIVTGITGLGKTALAERLATVELREDYPNYKVVNFDEEAGTQDFVSAAENLLNQLGEKVTADERKNPNGLLNRLLQKLRSRRYLVQMDSLEVLLKGQGDDDRARNEFEDEHWSVFFNGLLAGQDCQSRLILTSQDLPTHFGSRYEKFWAEEPLKGLNEAEQFELFQKLFRRKEKEIGSESEAVDYLKRMGKAYEGHPLVIEVIAGEILAAPFNGNVMTYWHRYRQEFEVIKPVIGHQQLQLKVKDRVRKSLKRLAQDVPDAYTLLCRSSVYRRPVPESFWLAMLGSLTQEGKAAALGTLQFRYLVFAEDVTSAGQFLLRQHNLIRSVAYELLMKTAKESSQWQDTHYTAVKMWRTAYEPEPDALNLEKVRGYLEAFHHLCQVADWEKAREILTLRLDTPTNDELHNQLHLWGYYQEQIDLYRQILGKLNPRVDCLCWNGLGNAYHLLGEYCQAIEFHQQHLEAARSVQKQQDEEIALGNLGNIHCSLGDYLKGIDYHKQSLSIADLIHDYQGMVASLGSLGNAYRSLGDYPRAIDYYEQSLAIALKIKDRYGEATAVAGLGAIHYELGDYHEAINWYVRSLAIAQEIQDRHIEGISLGGVGIAYSALGDYVKAIEYEQQVLAIARETKNKENESMALCDLGVTLLRLEEYQKALEYLQLSLEVCRQIANPVSEVYVLINLTVIYHKLEQYEQAHEYCDRAISIATELGIPLMKECQELKEQLLSEST